MVAKNPDAFRTISEVAEDLDLPQHVLRFWETRFTQIKPLKRGGGRRYYRPDDVDLLRGIRLFLYGEGYTIRGVQRILKEQGVRFVMAAGRGELTGMMPGRADPRRLEDDDSYEGDPHDGEIDEPDTDLDPAPRPSPPQPARRLPLRPGPAFDVEPEDHDPDEEPRHLAPFRDDEEEDGEDAEQDRDDGDDVLDDDDAIRRMAERFAPATPPPPPPASRRDPPPPPRAAPPRPPPRPEPRAEPRQEPVAARPPGPPRVEAIHSEPPVRPPVEPAPPPRPQPAPRPVRQGLSSDDVAQLQDTMAELLELKRILDQAR